MQSISFLCITIFISLIGLSLPAHAQDNTCVATSVGTPKIEIIVGEVGLAYDLKVSRKHLAGLKERHEQSFSEFVISGDTLGLTLGTYSYQLSLSSAYQKTGWWSGGYCPDIRKVTLQFNYESKIYVAKEYARNKCAFNVILNHELDHHNVNVSNKQKYLGWLQKDLGPIIGAIAKKHKPAPKNRLQSANDNMQKEIEDAIDVYFHHMHTDTNIQNQKLDTKSEYLRLNRAIKRCYKNKR